MNEDLRRLEEKIAYLERHVTEQDKAMLEMGDALTRLRREVRALRERIAGDPTGGDEEATSEERPPHY